VYPAGGDGLYMVVDEKAVFRDSSFQKAVNALSSKPGGDASNKNENGKTQKGGRGGPSEPSDMFKIVKMIMQRQFDPVIVFSFSKRNCEENANQVCNWIFEGVSCLKIG
jgi:ATP-dependent RNA helicase DOB1